MVGELHPVDAGRSPAHRAAGGPGSRAAARHAVLPRPGQPRLRQERERRHGLRRLRARAGRRAGRTASRGITPRRSLPPDYERFAPLMAGAIRRFPFLADAEVDPAGLPSRRDDPGREPAARAAAGGPRVLGRCRAVAQRLRWWRRDRAGASPAGSPPATPAWTSGRTGPGGSPTPIAIPHVAAGLARETYSDYYRLRYPYDADLAGRPRRLSPLHGRLQETGAVFGTKAGWERADIHRAGPALAAGRARPGARYGWTRPPWFERVAPRAARSASASGIIDLSSFGKIDVAGPGALGAAPARRRQRRRPARRQRRLHAVAATSAAGWSPT